jgi:hypothetical protein
MSDQVNVTAQIKFLNNIELTLQQNKSKVASLAMVANTDGAEKAKIKDFFGAVATRTGNDRHGDTQYTNTPHEALWLVKPDEDYVADLVDRNDQKATSIEIGSGYIMSQAGAINRYWDDVCLAALYGSVISGKQGTTVTALGSSMTVPVTEGGASGNQGMNVEKLDAADQLLLEAYNDPDEQKFIAMCAKQNRQLAREVKVTSSDFSALGGRVDPKSGLIVAYKGWSILNIELSNPLLPRTAVASLDGSGFRQCPYWKASGLAIGWWEKVFASVDPLPTKRFSKQYYAASTAAATRTQAGKSGLILCA